MYTLLELFSNLTIFSHASAKAGYDLSSLSGMFLCVELGTPQTPPTPPLEMAFPLGIS